MSWLSQSRRRVLLRLLTTAISPAAVDRPLLAAVLAAATMTLGNLAAFFQTSPKWLLAYSTISQAGYRLMGIAATPPWPPSCSSACSACLPPRPPPYSLASSRSSPPPSTAATPGSPPSPSPPGPSRSRSASPPAPSCRRSPAPCCGKPAAASGPVPRKRPGPPGTCWTPGNNGPVITFGRRAGAPPARCPDPRTRAGPLAGRKTPTRCDPPWDRPGTAPGPAGR